MDDVWRLVRAPAFGLMQCTVQTQQVRANCSGSMSCSLRLVFLLARRVSRCIVYIVRVVGTEHDISPLSKLQLYHIHAFAPYRICRERFVRLLLQASAGIKPVASRRISCASSETAGAGLKDASAPVTDRVVTIYSSEELDAALDRAGDRLVVLELMRETYVPAWPSMPVRRSPRLHQLKISLVQAAERYESYFYTEWFRRCNICCATILSRIKCICRVCETGLFEMSEDQWSTPKEQYEAKMEECMGIRSVFMDMAATSLSARFYCVMVCIRYQLLLPDRYYCYSL